MTEVYTVVAQLDDDKYAVSSLCEALGVSRSAYYAWRRNEFSVRRREDSCLKPLGKETGIAPRSLAEEED